MSEALFGQVLRDGGKKKQQQKTSVAHSLCSCQISICQEEDGKEIYKCPADVFIDKCLHAVVCLQLQDG